MPNYDQFHFGYSPQRTQKKNTLNKIPLNKIEIEKKINKSKDSQNLYPEPGYKYYLLSNKSE